jgi:hypothetical protein
MSVAALLPEWLPEGVRGWIIENQDHPAHVAGRETILALANSWAMHRLWRELARRKPVGWLHPLTADFVAWFCPGAEESAALRESAYALTFKEILSAIVITGPALVEREASAAIQDFQSRAAALRQEASAIERDPSPLLANPGITAANLRTQAENLEATAELLPKFRLFVKNSRGNPHALALGFEICGKLTAMFGDPLREIAAQIATAASGETLTAETLREVNRRVSSRVTFRPRDREKSHRET